MAKALTGVRFSETYKHDCFLKWYRWGKPALSDFILRIPKDEHGRRPNKRVMEYWLPDWKIRAAEMDLEIEQGLIDNVVAEKVEMLQRHVDTAQEMQNMSLEYLREHKDDLTPNAAVRLLQLGVEIERESVGIPEALKKLSGMDDEALLTEISSILKESEVDIESLDNENED